MDEHEEELPPPDLEREHMSFTAYPKVLHELTLSYLPVSPPEDVANVDKVKSEYE